MKGKKTSGFELGEYIPISFGVLFYMSYSNQGKFYRKLDQYWEQETKGFLAQKKNLEKQYEFSVKDFRGFLGNEVALCHMTSGVGGGLDNKIITIKMSDAYNTIKFLGKLGKENLLSTNGTNVDNIGLISIPEFPSRIWGNAMKGFTKTYFTRFRDCLLLSNDISQLRKSLTDLKTGKTLKQGVNEINKEIEGENLYVGLNLNQSWDLIYNYIRPSWKEFVQVSMKAKSKV